jgi:beta-lactamase class A
MPTRRTVITAGIPIAFCPLSLAHARQRPQTATHDAVAALEAIHGGRLGVAALDTGSGESFGYRTDERFPMCSTHKVLTAAAALASCDQGRLRLDQPIAYTQADLLAYAPITKQNAAAGFMTVAALCAAAIEWSDNTAANLLLNLVGGPSGWTRYARSLGDETSRLDRIEPDLNTAIPGDDRDSTTPAAMVRDLNTLLLGDALTKPSRAQLETWMRNGTITGTLLRAGLPRDWRVGDKSGSGDNGTRNDIGIIWPPDAAPILAATYCTGSTQPLAAQDHVIAEVGRILATTFSP